MVHIHSLKKELLLQEIYGKLTFYNFSSYLLIVMDGLQKETERKLTEKTEPKLTENRNKNYK